jgi:hypothetical protein
VATGPLSVAVANPSPFIAGLTVVVRNAGAATDATVWVAYRISMKAPPKKDMQEILEGTGVNAGNCDLRIITRSPNHLLGLPWPKAAQTLQVVSAPPGAVYQVLRDVEDAIRDVTHSLQFVVYRISQADAATAQDSSEGEAGVRKEYVPIPSGIT